jgi:D-beta-D-heptose 7-phosphate kinase/D-beta-D-heptose 1-phosphate adenosyltransferase
VSVQALKGKSRPILSETDRIELIAAMEMVDYVVMFTEPDPLHVISVLRPDILVKGGDWSPERIIGADVVEAEGGKVAVIPYVKGFSTTEIIDKVRS